MGEIMVNRVARFVELTSPARQAATLDEMFQRMTSRVPGIVGPEGDPEGLPAICAAWDVPYGRVLTWLMADVNRYAVYKRALEVRAHGLVSETVQIADGEGFPQDKKVRIDTRFKVAKHHAPDVYGERLEVVNTERMEVVLETPAIALLKLVRKPADVQDAEVVDEDGGI